MVTEEEGPNFSFGILALLILFSVAIILFLFFVPQVGGGWLSKIYIAARDIFRIIG